MRFRQRIAAAICFLAAPFAFGQLAITTSSLPGGNIGIFYSTTLQGSGGSPKNYQWAIVSDAPPPPGLSVTDANLGVISGTPTKIGTYPFTVQLTSPNSPAPVQKQLSITISTPPLSITTTSPLPPGMVGRLYSQRIIAAGGSAPYTFSIPSTPFNPNPSPPGLSIDPKSGVLSGTPAAASPTGAPYSFLVLVTDGQNQQASTTFSLTVTSPLIITTTNLPNGGAGNIYNQTLAASGGTPPYVFNVSAGSLPNGIGLTATGALTGTPTDIGPFNFTAQVTDNLKFATTQALKLVVAAAAPSLQVSPLQLSFTVAIGGDVSVPQTVAIIPSGTKPVPYSVTVDGGAANTTAPAGFVVTPLTGTAPGALTITFDPLGLRAGSYQAGIHVTVPRDSAQATIDIAVTLTVTADGPRLSVAPGLLRFRARVFSAGTQDQVIAVRNAGGGNGTLPFTASVVGKSSWITSVTPNTSQANPNAPALVHVVINTTGLTVGNHHDIIRFISQSGGSSDVPISVFVQDQGPALALGSSGTRFHARQGFGLATSQSVSVLNLGDPNTTVNWTADLVSGSDWLTLTKASGTATTTQPGSLVLTPSSNVANLPAGPRYALVRVTDSNALGSPQYFVAVLEISPTGSLPALDESVSGLFFATPTGAAPQSFQIFTSSSSPVAFQVATSTQDGASWLAATPTDGSITTQSPATITVTVTRGLLNPGIYTGGVNISLGGALRTINITYVIVPAGGAAIPAQLEQPRAAGTCVGAKLAATEVGIPNNFAVPAGWPATLIVQLNDDCGNPVNGGSVTASFSNGDPPLTLPGDLVSNVYSATWQPGVTFPQMTVTVRASAGGLQPVSQQFTGAVDQNSAAPPSFYPGGTLHIFYDIPTTTLLGDGLAPGTVLQVYGTGLAASTISPPNIPLPPDFNGTFMAVGPAKAPIYSLCSHCAGPADNPTQLDLIDVQLPSELTANRQYSAVVSANGALTLPETIDVSPLSPGIAIVPGTSIALAQHFPSYQLITAGNPARPGENVVVYLAGMGATNPPVNSGNPTPLQEVKTTVQPTVKLDGQSIPYGYAGLTPTGVGLYQINFVVPTNARAGNLDLVVIQNDSTSNITQLIVGSP